MFSINVGYPTVEEEQEIVRRTTVGQMPNAEPVLSVEQLLEIQQLMRRLPANGDVIEYCVSLVNATRPQSTPAASKWIHWGAGLGRANILPSVPEPMPAVTRNPNRDDVRAVARRFMV